MTFDNPNLPAPFNTTFKLADNKTDFELNTVDFYCEILNKEKCPVVDPIALEDFYFTATPDSEGIVRGTMAVKAKVTMYKYLKYSSMPKYLMGTDKSGKDMLKLVFEGLRTSLLLGVITFVVCFTFGLIWGSISGYFGGTVDLAMERIMEIFSGIPWMVAMTLIIIHLGSNFVTLAIALCATGWMSTASRTRTQFYRFKGREYVLASRTLGASDARLIVKHILPNSLGTIITGAVLMIPSVIFSESGLAFLGLVKNLSSIGVILYDNQPELLTSSYLLLFPAIVIALLMISFNLFGNGLRDAVNPSLKGED
jgi:oligopeptide transport system permease protein